MAVCEFSQAYVSYLITKVDIELGSCSKDNIQSQATILLNCTDICQTLNKITLEDAKNIKEKVIAIYPQLQEAS